MLELPGVVTYPDDGSDATDHLRLSQLFDADATLDAMRLIGTNGNCIILGELIRGLSMGLAGMGEWERGEMFATKLNRCRATAALRAADAAAVDEDDEVGRFWPAKKLPPPRLPIPKPPFSFALSDSVGAEFPSVELRTRTRFEMSLPLPE